MKTLFFNVQEIQEQMLKLKKSPPFKPEKFEPRFTCTQLFETGIEATISFVIRNGQTIIYDSKQEKI